MEFWPNLLTFPESLHAVVGNLDRPVHCLFVAADSGPMAILADSEQTTIASKSDTRICH